MGCLTPDFLKQLTQCCGYRLKAHLPLAWSAAASQHFCKSDPRVRNDASRKRSHNQSWEKCLVHTTCSIRIHWKGTEQIWLSWRAFIGKASSRALQSLATHNPDCSTCPCFILLTVFWLTFFDCSSIFLSLSAPRNSLWLTSIIHSFHSDASLQLVAVKLKAIS